MIEQIYQNDLATNKAYKDYVNKKSIMDTAVTTAMLAKNLFARPIKSAKPDLLRGYDMPSMLPHDKQEIDQNIASQNAVFNDMRKRNVDTEVLRRAGTSLVESKNKAYNEASKNELKRIETQLMLDADVDNKNAQLINMFRQADMQARLADNLKRGEITSQLLTQLGSIASGYKASKVTTSAADNKALVMKYLMKHDPDAFARLFASGTDFDYQNIAQRSVGTKDTQK